MINAYVPLATCQFNDSEAIKELSEIVSALNNHELIRNVFIHPTEEYHERYISMRLDKRGGETNKKRYKAIALNVLDCYQDAAKQKDEFILMCNSNKIQRWIPRLNDAYEYVKNTPKCGIVSPIHRDIPRNGAHIAAGFTICRTEAIKHIKFSMIMDGSWDGCHCISQCQELRKAGWEVSYHFNGTK